MDNEYNIYAYATLYLQILLLEKENLPQKHL